MRQAQHACNDLCFCIGDVGSFSVAITIVIKVVIEFGRLSHGNQNDVPVLVTVWRRRRNDCAESLPDFDFLRKSFPQNYFRGMNLWIFMGFSSFPFVT
jgi:hypothetical protein